MLVFKNAPLKYKFPVKLFHIYYTCSLFFIIHVKHWTKENSTTLYLENEITLVDSAGSMFQIMLQIFFINHISIDMTRRHWIEMKCFTACL
mgnify:CR=1 FL=1